MNKIYWKSIKKITLSINEEWYWYISFKKEEIMNTLCFNPKWWIDCFFDLSKKTKKIIGIEFANVNILSGLEPLIVKNNLTYEIVFSDDEKITAISNNSRNYDEQDEYFWKITLYMNKEWKLQSIEINRDIFSEID